MSDSQYCSPIVRISTPVDSMHQAVGTGFCINNTVSDDVIFLTNAHVVAPGSQHFIEVVWAPGHPIPIHVSAIVYDRDIALLKCPRTTWESMANTYLSGQELEMVLSIPTLTLGDDSMFSASGTPVMCKGHPLGLPEQQVSYGNTRGVINMPNGEQRNLIQAPINHGNSGGPVLVNYKGKEYVVGISTMKLSGKDVEGEGGMININEIRAVLQTLMSTVKPLPKIDAQTLAKLRAVLGSTFPSAAVAALSPEHRDWLSENAQSHKGSWNEHAVAGRVGGVPRTFTAWVLRHVVNNDSLLKNGQSMLHYVMDKCIQNQYSELSELKTKNGGWKSIRLNSEQQPVAITRMLRQKEVPTLIHAPILGWANTQPVHNVDYKEYYNTDVSGMIINTVYPYSLYANNGGCEGDLVYAFERSDIPGKLMLDKQGRYTKHGSFGARLSVATMCHNVPWDIGQENPVSIKLYALRPGGDKKTVEFTMRSPSQHELPTMHLIRPFNNESKDQNCAEIEGFQLAQMHMNHVQQMGLAEYESPEKQYKFRILCMGSPLGETKVAPGSVLLSMNGWDGEKEHEVKTKQWRSWNDFEAHMNQFEQGVKEGKVKFWKATFGRPGFKVTVIKKL